MLLIFYSTRSSFNNKLSYKNIDRDNLHIVYFPAVCVCIIMKVHAERNELYYVWINIS